MINFALFSALAAFYAPRASRGAISAAGGGCLLLSQNVLSWSSLEGLWVALGAVFGRSRWPDTDRWEVRLEGRLSRHLRLAMAPGERHLSKNID